MPKLVILLHHRFELWTAPPWLAERIRSDFPQVEVEQLEDFSRLEAAIAEAEIFFGWTMRPEQFRAARKLRWIHSPAAAVHQLMLPEIVASEVVITNARDVHGPVVAEHALALMFALAKRLPSAQRYQQQRVWSQQQLWDERPRPRELQAATLGLVGFGSIGRELARRALALGMRVLAAREHPERGSGDLESSSLTIIGFADLGRLLREADYVVLAAPLTPRTRHLVDRERLALMKPDAYLINVARGPLIDDAALVEALRAGRIAGAALDVFEREPLAAESPYWDLPNLLITPHSAALTEKLWERHYALIRENLQRYLSGQPLLAVVDKRKGY